MYHNYIGQTTMSRPVVLTLQKWL